MYNSEFFCKETVTLAPPMKPTEALTGSANEKAQEMKMIPSLSETSCFPCRPLSQTENQTVVSLDQSELTCETLDLDSNLCAIKRKRSITMTSLCDSYMQYIKVFIFDLRSSLVILYFLKRNS